jgi:predicted phage terminase large subunit-like protein
MPIPIKTSRYWPHVPHPPQAAFLSLPHKEAFYGGAAGGGKSDALLMAALQYVEFPEYAAVLFRRTYPDLSRPGGLIPRSMEWLGASDATWNANDHQWTFPSGATLTFAHLQHEKDKYDHQGAEYDFAGFDELTHFSETQYRYIFSRTRRRKDSRVPTRIRAASNPGGVGHDWVKDRFVTSDRIFIPAKLSDNPSLDQDGYRDSLTELDLHTRRQLLEGDWDARPPGDLFRRDWFQRITVKPDDATWVRFWDMAATEPTDANPDPDWTVGLLMGRTKDGRFVVADVTRLRARPEGVRSAVRRCADRDGSDVTIAIEQEPGSAGKFAVDEWQRNLADRRVRGIRSTGKKWDRAAVVSSKAEHGLIDLLDGPWVSSFLDEIEAFTQDDSHPHDDQVDALSGAYAQLAHKRPPTSSVESPWT